MSDKLKAWGRGLIAVLLAGTVAASLAFSVVLGRGTRDQLALQAPASSSTRTLQLSALPAPRRVHTVVVRRTAPASVSLPAVATTRVAAPATSRTATTPPTHAATRSAKPQSPKPQPPTRAVAAADTITTTADDATQADAPPASTTPPPSNAPKLPKRTTPPTPVSGPSSQHDKGDHGKTDGQKPNHPAKHGH